MVFWGREVKNFLCRGFWLVGIISCRSDEIATLPDWWEYTAKGGIARPLLLGRALSEAYDAESGLYYDDSLGATFQYAPLAGGRLWVEYYGQRGKVISVALLWENDSFPQLTEVYQTIRRAYIQRYGTPRGPVGDLVWQVGDSLRITLLIVPERRYIQSTFALLSLHEDLHPHRR